MLNEGNRAKRLVNGLGLLALSLAMQACGGGGSSADSSSAGYDLQAAMAQYYGSAKSWQMSGSVLVDGKPTPAQMTVSTQPGGAAASFPVTGKSYPFVQRTTTYRVAGQPTQTVVDRLYFDPATHTDVAMATDRGDSCSAVLVKRPLPNRALPGASGEGNSGVDYVNCMSGEMIEATYSERWELKQEGSRVLLCITDIRKSVANGSLSTGTHCLQVQSDNTLGAFGSLVTQEPHGGSDLRTQ